MIRSFFTVVLAFLIAFNNFISPVKAEVISFNNSNNTVILSDASSSVESLTKGFWEGIGGVIGAATGTVIVCYATNVAIAPFAPPIAGYLATLCPVVGGVVGGVTGAQGAMKAVEGGYNISNIAQLMSEF